MPTQKRARQVTRRARDEVDKLRRRERIVDAAILLLQKTPYTKISMDAVATRAQLAKGTVYLYFGTKEELFLAVLQSLLETWFADVDEGLSRAEAPLGTVELVAILAATLNERSTLSQLIADAGALEANVRFDTAVTYKRWLAERLTKTGTKLESCFGALAKGEGARVLLHLYTMIVGVSQLTRPAAVVVDALQTLQLAEFALQFEPELLFVAYHYLRGLEMRHVDSARAPRKLGPKRK